MCIASGSFDNTIELWDAVSGAHLNTLSGHSNSVQSVVFSPDGFRLASGSDDESIQLWNAHNGDHLNTLNGHSGPIHSVAFSSDSMRLASGSNDQTIRLWDAVSCAHLNSLIGHSSPVLSVAFSSDRTRIASGSYDETIRVWDIVNGTCLDEFKGHPQSAPSVASSLHPSGPSSALLPPENPVAPHASLTNLIPGYILKDEWIYALNWKRRICWVPVSCRPSSHDGGLAVSGDGNRIALGTGDGRVVILDLTGMGIYLQSPNFDERDSGTVSNDAINNNGTTGTLSVPMSGSAPWSTDGSSAPKLALE
ncbi:WD40 repeat-like protein [Rickenella mellea]|uniref:WD40 repeat-like protein n=1 Tax=Rickenella mellea TaxID=50990 RepID=A0A4Y7PWE8_9AGAM|nr:WD40 repeat-like protein [Rickenella mellea]